MRYSLGLRGTARTAETLAAAPHVPLRPLPADSEAAIQVLTASCAAVLVREKVIRSIYADAATQ